MEHARKQGDIFEVGGRKGTFAEAFPVLESVSADVTETGEGNAGLGLRRFTKYSIREYVNCSNHRCAGQGFSMGALLREMIEARHVHETVTKTCESREESGRPCPNHFEIVVELTYKSSETATR